MTLAFDHWLEVETNKIEEEWGIGFFEIEDLEFELELEPSLIEDRLKIKILGSDMAIGGGNQMFLHT